MHRQDRSWLPGAAGENVKSRSGYRASVLQDEKFCSLDAQGFTRT